MIIADTGFWIALASAADKHHRRAVEVIGQIDEGLVSTWPVITETCHVLATRVGMASATSFIRSYSDNAFDVFQLRREHSPRIARLMEKYADLPMDLADASLVLLAEHLGHGRIFSTDGRDFGIYRFKNHHPFENLLL